MEVDSWRKRPQIAGNRNSERCVSIWRFIEMSSTSNWVFWGQYIWDRAHIAVLVTVGDRDSPRVISDL